MLRRLTLRDVVIVAHLEVELDAGFTVLTGETGAGKSILVDAIELLVGGRADAGIIREGCERAEISGEFDSPSKDLSCWLEESDLGGDPGQLRQQRIGAIELELVHRGVGLRIDGGSPGLPKFDHTQPHDPGFG